MGAMHVAQWGLEPQFPDSGGMPGNRTLSHCLQGSCAPVITSTPNLERPSGIAPESARWQRTVLLLNDSRLERLVGNPPT